MLEAFDGYWRKAPSVKRVVIRNIPDETTRAAALKRGDVDVAYNFSGPVAEDIRRTAGLKLTTQRTNTVFYLDFVDQWDPKSPWADRRVRQAASLAVDRKAINEADFLGFAGLTNSVVPRHMEFALALDPPAFDPAQAKKLLAEAGYPNGFDGGRLHAESAVLLHGRGHRHQSQRGRHPHAHAHVRARRLPHLLA